MSATASIPSGARFAACSLRVRPGAKTIRVFPAGEFDAPRGALAGKGPWRTNAAIASQLIARIRSRSNEIPVDYEHQLLLSEQNGQPAPAAGWLDPQSFRWDEHAVEPGVIASVRWTERARAYIAADEYRYLSPVFTHDQTGAVLDLLHVGLTNFPAIDTKMVAALSAREIDLIVDDAIAKGRLFEPQRNWAKALGAKDVVALKAYVAPTSPVTASAAALSGNAAGALEPHEIEVCRLLGLTHDDYRKVKKPAIY